MDGIFVVQTCIRMTHTINLHMFQPAFLYGTLLCFAFLRLLDTYIHMQHKRWSIFCFLTAMFYKKKIALWCAIVKRISKTAIFVKPCVCHPEIGICFIEERDRRASTFHRSFNGFHEIGKNNPKICQSFVFGLLFLQECFTI